MLRHRSEAEVDATELAPAPHRARANTTDDYYDLSIGKPRPLTVGCPAGREAAEEHTDRVGRRRRSRPTARSCAPNISLREMSTVYIKRRLRRVTAS